VVSLLRKVDHDFVKEKLTMSEDDIKAVFTILDDKKNGYITINDLELLKN
jgi:Ca2+-binding EF-hand superfamily protein